MWDLRDISIILYPQVRQLPEGPKGRRCQGSDSTDETHEGLFVNSES